MISNDAPIGDPKDDQFGIDPFARAIARAIERLSAPEGTVLALTGPWGSGKSSAVNLIRHHLKAAEDNGELAILTLNPWWYADEAVLTRAFFQHLYAGLGKQLSNKSRKLILSLGKKLLGTGPLISSAADFFTFGIAGKVLELFGAAVADSIKTDRTVEDEFNALSFELRAQNKKFLIVVDDIDRLTPEQALLIFKLVKSVGRLPNVMYLLVFERELAERQLKERYPSERDFLEKIVQATFEIPLPDPGILHDAFLQSLNSLSEHPSGQDGVRFRNVISDVVNPLIRLPRDIVRLIGNVNVSWAAIGAEIDFADLVAIEALRLFRFSIHQAIRQNKTLLCGTGGDSTRGRDVVSLYDGLLLDGAENDLERNYRRTALRRLFPRLDSVWANVYHSSSGPIWRAKRLVCDPTNFPSYFRLAVAPDVLPRHIISRLIESSGNREAVAEILRERSRSIRRDGQSEVPLILEELQGVGSSIPNERLSALFSGIFEVADEIDLECDEVRGAFGFGNQLRIQWLLNEYVRDRLPLHERNALFRELVPNASLGWAIDLTRRIREEHWPRNQNNITAQELRLTEADTATELVQITLGRIRNAAREGEILRLRDLASIFYRWREFSGNDDEVRTWVNAHLEDNEFVLRLAREFTTTSWVTSMGFDGMGDRVSQGVPSVRLHSLDNIVDVELFLTRMRDLRSDQGLDDASKVIVARFFDGLARENQNPARRDGTGITSNDGEMSRDDAEE